MLGQAPPAGSPPDFWPFDCDTGTRLARYAGFGSRERLLGEWVTANLNPECLGRNAWGSDIFDLETAHRTWDEWSGHVLSTYDRVLVCGAGPASVVLPGADMLCTYSLHLEGQVTLLAWCPHPSGGNRWWNDAEKAKVARRFLNGFMRPGLGTPPEPLTLEVAT